MCRCVRDGYSLLVYIYICSYVVCGAFVWSMCTSIYMYVYIVRRVALVRQVVLVSGL